MIPVTDPSILAELEGAKTPAEMAGGPNAVTGRMKPVRDPALLAELESDRPLWDIPGDIGRAASESASGLAESATAASGMQSREEALRRQNMPLGDFVKERVSEIPGQLKGAVMAPLQILGLAMSPVTGASRAIGGSAISAATGIPKKEADEGIDTAMMGLRGVGMSPRAAPGAAIRQTPAATRLETTEAAGITPRLPSVTQNRGVGVAANAVKEVPIGGTPLVEGARANLAEGAAEAGRIAAGYGTVRNEAEAGRGVQAGIERFANADPAVVPSISASQPSRQIGFGNKADALYDRVQGMIPQGAPLATNATQDAFRAVVQRFPSNQRLGEGLTNPRLQDLSDRLGTGTLTWPELREFRTIIRRMNSNPGLRQDIDQAMLTSLERAMTADLTTGAQATAGPQAVRAFQNADRFYAAGMSRVEALQKLTSTTSPEQAFERLITAAQDSKSTSNITLLNQAKRSLGPDEWGNVASTMIERMGQPKAGNVAEGMPRFSFSEFFTNYEKLSPQARAALFDNPAAPGLRASLDRLAQVSGQMKNVDKLGNPSGTGRAVTATGLISGPGGAAAMTGDIVTPLVAAGAALGSTRLAASLMNSPNFVRLLVRAGQMRPGYTAGWANQVALLGKQEPELAPAIKEFLANLTPGNRQ